MQNIFHFICKQKTHNQRQNKNSWKKTETVEIKAPFSKMFSVAIVTLMSRWTLISGSRNVANKARLLSHQGEVKIDKVPGRFLDPIYMHIMLDPVVLPNGTTIDRRSFEEIMKQPERRNPYSREPLDPSNVPPPNLFAKNEIADFVKDHAIDTR
jgi:hypothetical protein